ncbi:MAG: hypothetical protein IKM81_09845 [Fibrobacter sp.]|nr:hypothetical protein [Fibrobacter sp.]
MTVDMSDIDKAIERYEEKREIAKKMRDKNVDISIIVDTTNLSEEEIRAL